MHPLEDGDWDFLEEGWKWRGDISMEIDDPLFTPMGIDLWDLMDRIMLEDPEYAKLLVLPKNDGRFDDAEEDQELKEFVLCLPEGKSYDKLGGTSVRYECLVGSSITLSVYFSAALHLFAIDDDEGELRLN
ncbi:hypothetical protein RIF29_19314 [Crotalaria pallida]|uniref:Uncharacterized protein n=1 Tax=Crotalaria pallida TaxID=3830 RepID=A0AAN9I6E3_CROPI